MFTAISRSFGCALFAGRKFCSVSNELAIVITFAQSCQRYRVVATLLWLNRFSFASSFFLFFCLLYRANNLWFLFLIPWFSRTVVLDLSPCFTWTFLASFAFSLWVVYSIPDHARQYESGFSFGPADDLRIAFAVRKQTGQSKWCRTHLRVKRVW